MKRGSCFFMLFLLLAGAVFAQKMTVKDSDANILMEVNDEGTVGSITVPLGSAPVITTNKLYNVSGSLFWSGSALGTAGSAGGWTDEGANVYTTTSTDKVGIGTSSPEFKLSLDDDGGIVAKGAILFGATLTTSGEGTRLIWYPKSAAFRAGYVNGTQWDSSNIGFFSTAMGNSTTASGNNSMAMGFNTTASSYASQAMGRYNVGGGTANIWIPTDPLFEIGIGVNAEYKANAVTVLKDGRVGIGTSSPEFKLSLEDDGGIIAKGGVGNGTTLGTSGEGTRMIWYPKSAAFRAGYVDGTQWDSSNIGVYSTAMGGSTTASGLSSTALGDQTTASGEVSTAMGLLTTASGNGSTAMGNSTTASGNNSTAMGFYTMASSYASQAMGRYNVGGGTADSWVSTDPLFEIGIGGSAEYKADAVTVLKDGRVGIGDATPDYLLDMEVDASGGGFYDSSDHQWHDGSSRKLKQDIALNDLNVQDILSDVQIVKYRFKTEVAENPNAPYHVGFIAEDTPEMLSGKDRNGMATGDCIGLLLAVVKEQQKEIETLKTEMKELRR